MIQLDGIKTAIPKLRETLIEVGDSLRPGKGKRRTGKDEPGD